MLGVSDVDSTGLREIAANCVALVATDHVKYLDWSLDSLIVLDEVVCALIAEGPLPDQWFDLWWKLAGAYTGEVIIEAYGGEWINHERAEGAYAVHVLGVTAFPFATAHRVLSGEYGKSLASIGRVLPVIAARSASPE